MVSLTFSSACGGDVENRGSVRGAPGRRVPGSCSILLLPCGIRHLGESLRFSFLCLFFHFRMRLLNSWTVQKLREITYIKGLDTKKCNDTCNMLATGMAVAVFIPSLVTCFIVKLYQANNISTSSD